jgi:hypothetical protein
MIPIFSAINEVAVVGTACLMVAVHTFWFAVPASSLSKGEIVEVPRFSLWTVLITFISFLLVVGCIAYAVSFSSILKMTTLQIGSAIALFAVAAQVSLYSQSGRTFLSAMNNAGFTIICIISGAFVLQYWPW